MRMSSTAGSRRWSTVRLSTRVASASIARFGVTLPPFGCGGGGIGGAGSESRAAEAKQAAAIVEWGGEDVSGTITTHTTSDRTRWRTGMARWARPR